MGERRLADADLARKLQLKKTQFSKVTRWMTGENAVRFEDVVSIADALGFSLDWLAGRIPGPNEEASDEALARTLRTLTPDQRKIVLLLQDPRAAAHLARAAEQYEALKRSLAR